MATADAQLAVVKDDATPRKSAASTRLMSVNPMFLAPEEVEAVVTVPPREAAAAVVSVISEDGSAISTEIGSWLTSSGLSEYASKFVVEKIEMDMLNTLTEADLTKLGLRMGDIRRFRAAARRALGEDAEDPDANSSLPDALSAYSSFVEEDVDDFSDEQVHNPMAQSFESTHAALPFEADHAQADRSAYPGTKLSKLRSIDSTDSMVNSRDALTGGAAPVKLKRHESIDSVDLMLTSTDVPGSSGVSRDAKGEPEPSTSSIDEHLHPEQLHKKLTNMDSWMHLVR